MEELTIADIKARVEQIEGFSVDINGKSTKKMTVRLYKKSAPGTMTVPEWINRCFPECVDGEVRVLRKSGSPFFRVDLKRVRDDYAASFRKNAKSNALATQKSQLSAIEAAEKDKALRSAKKAIKQQEKANVTEVNQRQAASHEEAAWQALDQIVRKDLRREPAPLYHARVLEHCQSMLKNEMDTESVLRRMLEVWTYAEIEKDRLAQ